MSEDAPERMFVFELSDAQLAQAKVYGDFFNVPRGPVVTEPAPPFASLSPERRAATVESIRDLARNHREERDECAKHLYEPGRKRAAEIVEALFSAADALEAMP